MYVTVKGEYLFINFAAEGKMSPWQLSLTKEKIFPIKSLFISEFLASSSNAAVTVH